MSTWRCVFNNSLRAWCGANNRVLFDIADIEAHVLTNGDLLIFIYNGQLCEQLWSGDNQGGDACCSEVGDGAHPTNFGAEELLARGFYAVAAATPAGGAPGPRTRPPHRSRGQQRQLHFFGEHDADCRRAGGLWPMTRTRRVRRPRCWPPARFTANSR